MKFGLVALSPSPYIMSLSHKPSLESIACISPININPVLGHGLTFAATIRSGKQKQREKALDGTVEHSSQSMPYRQDILLTGSDLIQNLSPQSQNTQMYVCYLFLLF
jgi:hypothetical protein